MVIAVLSLQLHLECELRICSSLDSSSIMSQHLVPTFSIFLVNANVSADTDEHCSYLNPFESAVSVNFVCLVAFARVLQMTMLAIFSHRC